MPVVKKLVAAASLLAIGVSTAFFFRKDASELSQGESASWFQQPVERRVAAQTPWSQSLRTTRPDLGRAKQVPRVSAPAPAAIPQPGTTNAGQPVFQNSFHPGGALLQPIEPLSSETPTLEVDDDLEGGTASKEAAVTPATHRVADGDTLRKLAARYLGDSDRYLEIFELNRGLLGSPDLLPIGTLLKLPESSRQAQPALEEPAAPPLTPVPLKPVAGPADSI